jgi:hypothetical protein
MTMHVLTERIIALRRTVEGLKRGRITRHVQHHIDRQEALLEGLEWAAARTLDPDQCQLLLDDIRRQVAADAADRSTVVEVRMAAKAYYAALDPAATEYPREANLPEPSWYKIGAGFTVIYRITRAAAADMAEHLDLLADTFASGIDKETRAEGRACRLAAERIRGQLQGRGK